MARRTNPHGMRLSTHYNWLSQWYTKDCYANVVTNDYQIRTFVAGLFAKYELLLGEIRIVRNYIRQEIAVDIEVYSATKITEEKEKAILAEVELGLEGIEPLRKVLKVWLVGVETENIRMSSTLLANYIVENFERKKYLPAVEREIKQLLPRLTSTTVEMERVENVQESNVNNKGVRGLRIEFAGRFSKKGRRSKKRVIQIGIVPVQTVREMVDYCATAVITRYGSVGIKVWLYKD